jgi:hypothetical protein
MVKKANNKRPVNLTPPKAIDFPELLEKSHIQCHPFIEDQVLLLGVRLFVSARLCIPNISCLRTFLHQWNVEDLSNLLTTNLWS